VLRVARPVASRFAVPNTVPLANWKVTVPGGIGEPDAVPATVAVKVADWPTCNGEGGFTDRVVVVGVTTSTSTDAAVLPRKGDPDAGL
jgi:hypothetical protein